MQHICWTAKPSYEARYEVLRTWEGVLERKAAALKQKRLAACSTPCTHPGNALCERMLETERECQVTARAFSDEFPWMLYAWESDSTALAAAYKKFSAAYNACSAERAPSDSRDA